MTLLLQRSRLEVDDKIFWFSPLKLEFRPNVLSPSVKGDDTFWAPSLLSGKEAGTTVWELSFLGKAADATVVDGAATSASLCLHTTFLGKAADAMLVDGAATSASLCLHATSFSPPMTPAL